MPKQEIIWLQVCRTLRWNGVILPIHEHLQLHASQYKHKTQHPSHPLHNSTTYFNTPRLKKHYI